MLECKETRVSRILNPTAIDLGEYVINPYRGCGMGCLYCYARFIKVSMREPKPWGSYVYVKTNAPELLERELRSKKPHCVLLGSTTECFQDIELRYKLTHQILAILNKSNVSYYILTRSPHIAQSIGVLREGFCRGIYFTVNAYDDSLKKILEPRAASFKERIACVKHLKKEGLPVVPYVSPVLPWLCDIDSLLDDLDDFDEVEFEGLNFRLGNIPDVIDAVGNAHEYLKERYRAMHAHRAYYQRVWQGIQDALRARAARDKKKYDIFVHRYEAYFENTYVR